MIDEVPVLLDPEASLREWSPEEVHRRSSCRRSLGACGPGKPRAPLVPRGFFATVRDAHIAGLPERRRPTSDRDGFRLDACLPVPHPVVDRL